MYFDSIVGIAAAGFCAALLFGCQQATSGPELALDPSAGVQFADATIVAPRAPPPKRAEIPPRARVPGSLWEFGHWHWSSGRFVWVPGRYIERPAPSANWMPGYWDEQANGWVWVEGRWSS
jgi:WXXGXW repeat (2 copies)